MHDVESKVFVVTELPAVMATIYFSVFHSVLVPYFRMKAGASEVKTEEPSACTAHSGFAQKAQFSPDFAVKLV